MLNSSIPSNWQTMNRTSFSSVHSRSCPHTQAAWWRHEMETFPRYWSVVRGIHRSPVNSTHKRPVTRSCDVFFDLGLYQQLSKQWRRRWFETQSRALWRHCNGNGTSMHQVIRSFIESMKRGLHLKIGMKLSDIDGKYRAVIIPYFGYCLFQPAQYSLLHNRVFFSLNAAILSQCDNIQNRSLFISSMPANRWWNDLENWNW